MTTTQPTPAATPAATSAAIPAVVPVGKADVVEAARLLLAQMGIEPHDLLAGAPMAVPVVPARPPVPTIAEYVAVLLEVRPPGYAVYRHYWKRLAAKCGGRRLDEPTVSDLQRFVSEMRSSEVVRSRKNYRGGHSARLHTISAIRSMYRHAENDGWIRAEQNPARRMHRPRQLHPALLPRQARPPRPSRSSPHRPTCTRQNRHGRVPNTGPVRHRRTLRAMGHPGQPRSRPNQPHVTAQARRQRPEWSA